MKKIILYLGEKYGSFYSRNRSVQLKERPSSLIDQLDSHWRIVFACLPDTKKCIFHNSLMYASDFTVKFLPDYSYQTF